MDISHVDTSKPSYQASSIEEAVEIAYQLKADGEFDWFRGQVQEEWFPVSSLYRVKEKRDQAAYERVVRRVTMFYRWLDETPELKYLQEPQHVNDFFAIMQHYGIPTDYLDFTTDPGIAAFFSADTKSPPTGNGLSCIYCLDSKDLLQYWSAIADLDDRKGAEIELVEIDVQNLWRLQAQRGVFLHVNYNWQVDYAMFKIVYPYSGYPPYPTRDKIYPEDKSSLEQLLDQYFDVERARFTHDEMVERFAAIRARGGNANISYWKSFPQGFYAPEFLDPESMASLPSWNEETIQAWQRPCVEEYHETQGRTVKLTLNPAGGIQEIRKAVVFGMKQFFRSEPNSRSKTLNWAFESLPPQLTAKEVDEVLRRVWNGMRQLPYEDSDIAEACGSVAALLMTPFSREISEEKRIEDFAECFGPAIEVGFAHFDGSGSGGYATRESILGALRTDMVDLLTPESKPIASDAREIFRIIYNPRLMFEFEKFKKLFAREVIPSQAAWKRELILFNPARLLTFGLP